MRLESVRYDAKYFELVYIVNHLSQVFGKQKMVNFA